MPHLALISPKGSDFAIDEQLSDFLSNEPKMRNIRNLWKSPNLGLLTIAALTPKDWKISYIDEHFEKIDYDTEYDIVGISCMTQQVDRGIEIAKYFKAKGVITIFGGIHTTVRPEDVRDCADIIFIGEAELTWPQFVNDWKNGCWKEQYKEDAPGTLDMRKSPVPAYDIIREKDFSTITVHASRGCPHDCSFCAASKLYGPNYRRKKNEQIIEELRLIKKTFPNKYILFGDDNTFVSRDETKELLKEIAELNLRWVAQTDVSIGDDEELIDLMVKGGCQWIVIGLESISKKSLENVDQWKVDQVDKYKDNIAKIQAKGIGVLGAFVFGLDHDNFETMQNTIHFIEECNLYGIHVTSPTPFPGTRFRQLMIAKNRLNEKPWSYYTHWDILIKPNLLTEKELRECIQKIYTTFVSDESAIRRFKKFIGQRRLLRTEVKN